MLRPLRFLWKQFNGPQVTALFTATFRWVQSQFNAQLNYLLHFSIDTANDSHLTLIGASLGIVRPIVEIADARFFLFTRDPLHNEDYGVSDLANPTVGGIFSDLNEDLRNKTRVLCPATYYRRILQSYSKHSAARNSLEFIDNVLNDLWEGMHPGEASPISYHFYTYRETANRTVGDIEVLLGPLEMWGDKDTALIWQGVLSGVFNALFNPEQAVDVNFGVHERPVLVARTSLEIGQLQVRGTDIIVASWPDGSYDYKRATSSVIFPGYLRAAAGYSLRIYSEGAQEGYWQPSEPENIISIEAWTQLSIPQFQGINVDGDTINYEVDYTKRGPNHLVFELYKKNWWES